MQQIIISGLFGLMGGLIRALIGIIKNKRLKNKIKFKPSYLIITLIISAIIGMLTSTAFITNNLISLVIGYAGIDLLDNILKIIKRKF